MHVRQCGVRQLAKDGREGTFRSTALTANLRVPCYTKVNRDFPGRQEQSISLLVLSQQQDIRQDDEGPRYVALFPTPLIASRLGGLYIVQSGHTRTRGNRVAR